MNKIGIHFGYWAKDWNFDTRVAIKRAAKIGFDAIEIMAPSLLEMSDQQCSDLKKFADDLGIELMYSIGLGADMDLTSDEPVMKEYALKCMCDMVEKIGKMDGKMLAGVLYATWQKKFNGPITPEIKQHETDNSVAAVKKIAKVAEDYGVNLGVESVNRFEQCIVNTAEEALAYCKMVGSPNVKIHLDTFHMNIEENSMTTAIRTAGDYLGHFHVGENNRRLPGTGIQPWAEIFATLKDIGYKDAINMEPFMRGGGGVSNSVALWRDLTNGASEAELDDQAKLSLAFVRSFLK